MALVLAARLQYGGAVGFPFICDGSFQFTLAHTSCPAIDAQHHTSGQLSDPDYAETCSTTSLTVRFATANVLTLYPNRAVQGGFISARQEVLLELFHLWDL